MPVSSSSSSPATAHARTVRVWDLPTRLFHWGLAAAVVGLVVTAKTGAMDWHFRLGYAVMALLVFRLVWGFVGGRWSRFSSFFYAPGSMLAYLRGRPHPDHLVGHNPLGAVSVFALLAVLLLQVATGLVSDDAITFTGPLAAMVPGSWSSAATSWHKGPGQWLLIALTALHVLAVLFYVGVKRVRMVRPMLSGDRALAPGHAAPSSRDDRRSRLLALALFAASAGLAAWVSTLQS
ncbi:MAG: cytochrome B [Variovorax paradoxus]|uniref:Cytochrome B n=1 Tax=Variovorax paradoxus TaxID=34073 RepID=A0A2W5PLF6_VARPD|nr:MAG: cytochrome B [Variovorax paradoxus]